MLRIGTLVDGRYKILREIGRGGTSCVYLAENIRIHSYWAIKEVYKGVTGDGAEAKMLVAESNILTRLRHPGLPSIVDIINTQQSYLIVMEYIEGVSLDKILERQGACKEADVIKWGSQLCDVLGYLHCQQPSIIYRDMKPANIMLKPDGDVVLIDFGLAREYKKYNQNDTTNLGTHGYAAPEQYRGHGQSDARTDIYGLGVTLYHLLTGHNPCFPPFGINPLHTFNQNLSMQLDQIITKCTQIAPQERFQSANELKLALGSVVLGGTTPFEFEEEPKGRSLKWMWSFVSIPILIIAILVGVMLGNEDGSGYYYDGYYEDIAGEYIDDYIESGEDESFNISQYVEVYNPEEMQYFTFTPQKSGTYKIYSESGDCIPLVAVTDEYGNILCSDNTKGTEDDFCVIYRFEEGEVYYIATTLYYIGEDSPMTGSYWIYADYVY